MNLHIPFRKRKAQGDDVTSNRRRTPFSTWVTILLNVIVTGIISYGISVVQDINHTLKDLSVNMGIANTSLVDHGRRIQDLETTVAAHGGEESSLEARVQVLESQLNRKKGR